MENENNNQVRKIENVVFTEQRTLNTEALEPLGVPIENTFSHVSVSDSTWEVDQLLRRPHFVSSFTWSTGLAAGAVLLDFFVPDDILSRLTTSSMLYAVRLFTYLRMGVAFHLSLPGTQFHLGKLRLWFRAYELQEDTEVNTTYPLTPYAISGYPGIYMEASESQSGELILPFTSIFTYLNTWSTFDPKRRIGRIRLSVFNVLKTTDTSPNNLTGTLMFRMVNPIVKLPTQIRTDLYPAPTRMDDAVHDFTEQELEDATTAIMSDNVSLNREQVKEELAKFRMPKVARRAQMQGFGDALKSGITGAVQGGVRGGMTGGMEGAAIGAAMSGITEFLKNLDKPISHKTNYLKTQSNLSFGDGEDQIDRLSLFENCGYMPTSDLTCTNGNEMQLSYIRQRSMLIDRYTLSVNDTVGQIIYRTLVHPQLCKMIVDTGTDTIVQSTFLEWTSKPFSYWRGSLTFKLEFVTTKHHTGRWALVWRPGSGNGGELTDIPITATDFSALHYLIIDLAEDNVVSIKIPYAAEKTWCKMHTLSSFTNNTYTNIWSHQSLDEDHGNPLNNGELYLITLQPLRNPLGVPNSVDLNVYLCAGENYETSMLGAIPPVVTPINVFTPVYYEAQMQMLAENDSTLMTENVNDTESKNEVEILAKEDEVLPPIKDFFFRGQEFDNIRDIIRSYQGSLHFELAQTNFDTTTYLFTRRITPGTEPIPRTWMAYFARIFYTWSGSMRYKICTNVTSIDPAQLVVYHVFDKFYTAGNAPPPLATIPNGIVDDLRHVLSGYRTNFYNLSVTRCPAIETPYASSNNVLLLRKTNDEPTSLSDNGYLYFLLTTSSVSSSDYIPKQFNLYQSAGDDFAFHVLSPPPQYSLAYYTDEQLKVLGAYLPYRNFVL